MASKTLRVVTDDEKPAAKTKAKTITQAAADGTKRELLVAMRDRIAKSVEDPKCPPRDLASLSRRLMELAKEIEALEPEDGAGDGSSDGETPDEAFDTEAL